MNDPMRLVDELDPGFERDLLAAARGERAPGGARERVALGLFGVAAVAPIAAGAQAASPAGSGSLFASALKWLAIGAAAGGVSGTVGSALVEPRPAPAPVVSEAPPKQAETPRRVVTKPAPAAVPPVAAEPVKPAAAPVPRTEGTVVIGSPAASTEAQSLERIRVLGRKDPRRALAELDHHDARFAAHGVLGEKSRALRVQIDCRIRSCPSEHR